MNIGIEMYLRAMAHKEPKEWLKLLPWAELWFNTNYNASLGQTSFQTLYGKEAAVLQNFSSENSTIEAVEGKIKLRREALEVVKRNLAKAQVEWKLMLTRGEKRLNSKKGTWS